MEYEINLKDIKSRIFKQEDGWNNYMHISIEEMDWLVEQAEKAEKYEKALKEIADANVDTPFSRHLILHARRTIDY